MDVFQLIILSVLWFTLIFYVIKFYKKLTPEEKAELKQKPIQTVLEGFSPLGVTIFFTGVISEIAILKHFGALFLFISWFSSGVRMWDISMKRSIAILTITCTFVLSYYFFLI